MTIQEDTYLGSLAQKAVVADQNLSPMARAMLDMSHEAFAEYLETLQEETDA